MKLLISPTNQDEALEAIAGGADIIDVKNPKEGPLGANFPWVIQQIRAVTPKSLEVSCTIGEAPNIPGSIALAAYGAASLDVDYIKVGLGGIQTSQGVALLLANVNRAAKACNPKVQVVAAGYADYKKIDAVSPLEIPELASDAGVDVVMIDTAIKDGTTLFDHLTLQQLRTFITSAHDLDLRVALAGSLRKRDLPVVYSLGADIAGVRGAACMNSDRIAGQIKSELVHELVETVKAASKMRA